MEKLTREKLLQSKEYWMVKIQMDVYDQVVSYVKKDNLNIDDLAEIFGVSKNTIKQILNGDFDQKISKLVELCLKCKKIPVIRFVDLDEYIKKDALVKIAPEP